MLMRDRTMRVPMSDQVTGMMCRLAVCRLMMCRLTDDQATDDQAMRASAQFSFTSILSWYTRIVPERWAATIW